jgi:hypothetical protein
VDYKEISEGVMKTKQEVDKTVLYSIRIEKVGSSRMPTVFSHLRFFSLGLRAVRHYILDLGLSLRYSIKWCDSQESISFPYFLL